jgi:CDP-glucose 4,6-dehydratase
MGITGQLTETFKGRKVFLTGHTGFKGSWLIMLFSQLGASVKGYALTPENKSLYNQIHGDSLCQSVIGDIRDAKKIQDEIASFQPDFIFHLAAQALVRPSYEDPITTFETNVMGTANVLEAVRHLPGRLVFLVVTTDKVYENPESGEPFRESDRLGGHDPYSASKAAAEIVISSYRNSFLNNAAFASHQKSVSSARAGNVIGGGDWSKDRLIPDVVRSLVSGAEIVIRHPDAVRPWQHVLEPLTGYLQLAMRQFHDPLKFNEAWNFGPLPEQHYSVKEVVDKLIQLWGSGQLKIEEDKSKHEAQYLTLAIDKAERLGWSPQLTLDKTLKWTVDWYKRTEVNNEVPSEIMKEQINDYLKLLK